MIGFESIVADPFGLGRHAMFDIVHRNLFIGGIQGDEETDYIVDTSDGIVRLVHIGLRNRGALIYVPESHTRMICEFDEVNESDLKFSDEIADKFEDGYDTVLKPFVQTILTNILLGKTQNEHFQRDLRVEFPDVEINQDEVARFGYDFFIDGRKRNLEDFVLELNKADE